MIQTSDMMVPNLSPFVVNIPMASLDFFFSFNMDYKDFYN